MDDRPDMDPSMAPNDANPETRTQKQSVPRVGMRDTGSGYDEGGSGDDDAPRSEPAINLPRVLTLSLVLVAGLYAFQEYVLSGDDRIAFIVNLAFSPIRYAFPLDGQGFGWLWTPFTYSLLHGSVEHLGFNALWLAAFGAPVVRRIGAVRYIIFWALSAAASAFFHAALHWGDETILIGASGVVSALMGAACRFAFPDGGGYDRAYGHLYPRQSILGALSNRTVLIFTGMWLFGNVLVAVGLPLIGSDAGNIAWDAHIGGFLFGFLLFGLFDPIRYREIR